MTEVLPDIHQIRLPMPDSPLRAINGYLLKADDGWVLVDCGWNLPEVMEALVAQLSGIGVQLGDIRTLVVTHYHPDHYGLAGTIVGLTRARLLMHRLDWLFVDQELTDFDAALHRMYSWVKANGAPDELMDTERQRAEGSHRRYTIVKPHAYVDDGEPLRVGKHDFRFVWTPGHTAGHVCLYDAGRRVFLSGDHILDPISPNVSLNRENMGNPLGDYLSSLRKVGELDADLVLPAHGEPFNGLGRRVRELLAHHDEREQEVMNALEHGEMSAYQVAARLPWTRRRRTLAELGTGQQRFALLETVAHLEELRSRDLVARSRRDGTLYYELAPAGGR